MFCKMHCREVSDVTWSVHVFNLDQTAERSIVV